MFFKPYCPYKTRMQTNWHGIRALVWKVDLVWILGNPIWLFPMFFMCNAHIWLFSMLAHKGGRVSVWGWKTVSPLPVSLSIWKWWFTTTIIDWHMAYVDMNLGITSKKQRSLVQNSPSPSLWVRIHHQKTFLFAHSETVYGVYYFIIVAYFAGDNGHCNSFF